MSQRRALQTRIKTLTEMGEILDSMKTLALLEATKLERYLATQQRVMDSLEHIGDRLLQGYPELRTDAPPLATVCLVLGSERGFCGDYNDRLANTLAAPSHHDTLLIIVGQKLASRLNGDQRVVATLEGPTVAEEVDTVITRIVGGLADLQAEQPSFSLSILGHSETRGETLVRPVLPPFQGRDSGHARQPGYPPRLNIAPHQFLEELIEHYVFAAIHTAFYTALMAENRQRMEHLDGAIQHLDKTTAELHLKDNHLRQEEITEELEEVLLAAESMPQSH